MSSRSTLSLVLAALPEQLGDVRHLHETVVADHLIHAEPELAQLQPLAAGHLGHRLGHHVEQHHLLVQDLVVPQVVQQHRRYHVEVGGHEDRGATNARAAARWPGSSGARRWAGTSAGAPRRARAGRASRWSAPTKSAPPMSSGTQPPWASLERLADEEGQVDGQEEPRPGAAAGSWPQPQRSRITV